MVANLLKLATFFLNQKSVFVNRYSLFWSA